MNLENNPCTKQVQDWGLDPLFWTPVKLFVGDLYLALPHESNSVDDGTGVIGCVQFTPQEEQDDPIKRQSYELGSTVCIRGRLSVYRDERQVIISTSCKADMNKEALGWLERLSLRRYLKTSPFHQSGIQI
ncbi:hypothetical protein GGI12_004014 [Dipsacomyces acuminosporus]|nr:hypothetical protein GGI12_004014 [Dipsacomyces acuminosporus]